MRRLTTLLVLGLLLVAIGVLMVVAERAERMSAPVPSGTLGPLQVEPPPAIYPRGARVVLRPYEPGGDIVVMTDGTMPTTRVGNRYRGPIRLSVDLPGVRVLRAAEIGDASTGPVLNASYLVGLRPPVPVVSIIAEPADLWNPETGIMANPTWRGREWERQAHLTTFFGETVAALPVGLRVDGRELTGAPKTSLRIYVRQEYGASRLEAPIFSAHAEQPVDAQTYKRLLLQAGTHEIIWSVLRDQIAAEIARDLDLPVAEGRFVWLFVNGASWGLYRLTERVDRFMLEDNYGLVGSDVLVDGDDREGSDEDWDALVDWVDASDMRDPDTFAQLEARVDLDNLTDYLVFAKLLDLPAEALVAVQPPGGRWFWVLEGGTETMLVQPDLHALSTALLSNPGYRARFAQRAADIGNLVLTPTVLDQHLSALSATLSPVYDHERLRWPGAPIWQDEVAALRRVVEKQWLDLVGELDLSVELAVKMPDAGVAALYVDGIRVEANDALWTGLYGRTARVDLTAVPGPGQAAIGWQVDRPDGREEVASSQVSLEMTAPLTVTPLLGPAAPREDRAAPDDLVINELWINDDGTQYRSLGDRALEGDWVELLVRARGGLDLRGWRLTDNNALGTDVEGTLIFPDREALAHVPCGTVILIVATESPVNARSFPADDLDAADGRLVLYVGNGALDGTTDPGFAIGRGDDNLALLAPDPLTGGGLVGVDFVAEGREVTPYSFGILRDGVTFDRPFARLGADDGAFFRGRGSNDSLSAWHVDPTACESLDDVCLDAFPLVSPGRLNPGQQLYRISCRLTQDAH